MKIQVNRRDFISLDNIARLEERRGRLLVFKKFGYPHAIIASCGIVEFKMRIANAGGSFSNIPIIKEKKIKAQLISAFPGTGKTYFFNNTNKIVLDSDSSKFDKKEFPQNYINYIKSNINKADIILISSHKEVRDALVVNNLYFTLVYPDKKLKEDYVLRYVNRKSPEAFISLIKNNWNLWIDELKDQKNCNHVILKSNQYISDIIKE